MGDFPGFTDKIPSDIVKQAQLYIDNQIAIFKPRVYIYNVTLVSPDYNIVLPSTTPPPILIGKKEYEFRKNRLIIFNPDTSLICRKAVATEEYISIAIHKQFLARIACEMGFEKDCSIVFGIDNPSLPSIRQVINNIQREVSMFGGNLPLMMESMAIQLVVLLLRELESNFGCKDATQGDNSYVNKAIDYMQTYYNSNISIDDICRSIHITPYHFIRIFKEKTGFTPHAYLVRIRIENARKMLDRRECTVGEAAYLCGFSTVSHFSAAFKKQVGIAPSEYKKTYVIKPTQLHTQYKATTRP